MKHLKTYRKLFESSVEEIKEYLKDIALELTDVRFSVEISEPNMKNFFRYNVNIISGTKGKNVQFKLGDIKDVVCRMKDYMLSMNYFIEDATILDFQLDASGPSFNHLKVDKDPYKWDEDLELVLINIYFDRDGHRGKRRKEDI